MAGRVLGNPTPEEEDEEMEGMCPSSVFEVRESLEHYYKLEDSKNNIRLHK